MRHRSNHLFRRILPGSAGFRERSCYSVAVHLETLGSNREPLLGGRTVRNFRADESEPIFQLSDTRRPRRGRQHNPVRAIRASAKSTLTEKATPCETSGVVHGRKARSPRSDAQAKTDGRRRAEGKSSSVEPNITELLSESGKRSYRVQIRKTVAGASRSFTKTFSTLAMARKWKNRKLAEFEVNGVEVVAKSGDTVADAITARLAAHKHLGRSAKQHLNWIKASPFGTRKLSDLSLKSFTDLADEMLNGERLP